MARKFARGKAHISPSLTLNEEVLEYLELWADEEDRSLSSQISFLLKRAVIEKYGPIETAVKITHRRPRTDETGQAKPITRKQHKVKVSSK